MIDGAKILMNQRSLEIPKTYALDDKNDREMINSPSVFDHAVIKGIQPTPSTLLSMEPLIEMLTRELTNVENRLKIGGFVAEQYTHTESKVVASIGVGQCILSSQEGSSRKNSRRSSCISKADYYLRAQS